MKLSSSITAVQSRRRSALPVYILAAALFLGLLTTTPGFGNPANLINIVNQQVALACATFGQAFVILTGGLDLSVGSVVSMTTAILSLDLPPLVVTVIAIAAALLVGCANAAGILWLRIHPVLMTLGTMTIVQGIALLLRPTPGGSAPSYLVAFSQTRIGDVPIPVFFLIAVSIIFYLVLSKSRFGLHVLAAGGSSESAALGGVNVRQIVAACYVLSSAMACVAGFVLSGRIASGDPLIGANFAFDSVAAAALGGTLLAGGLGTIGGCLAGVGLLALLYNGLNFWNVSGYYQMLIKGGLLILAVSAHRRSEPGL
jgi:ribose transport system permease protein